MYSEELAKGDGYVDLNVECVWKYLRWGYGSTYIFSWC